MNQQLACTVTIAALAWACSEGQAVTAEPSGMGGPSVPSGQGIGQACSAERSCRAGLSCEDGQCEPSGDLAEGSPCTVRGECEQGLACIAGLCTEGGDGEIDESCVTDADCGDGLRCDLSGFSASCQPEGDADVEQNCETSSDCYAGLTCANGECTPSSAGPAFGLPWSGVSCEQPSGGSVRAYFEVPDAEDAEEGDFFRLPFPNDLRLSSGRPDLSGFPTPGDDVLGVDPVQIYLDKLSSEAAGWGAYPTVIFRFSGRISHDSFRPDGDRNPVSWVDITEGADEYGTTRGFHWFASGRRGNYVCQDWMAVRRPKGQPLMSGHTYAIWLTTDGRDAEDEAIERAPNLVSLLDDSEPDDSALADGYEAFAPLRDYLAAEDIDPDTILNATVITVDDQRALVREIAESLADEPVPEATGWVRCESGTESPCPQAEGDRACGDGGDGYDEYHALIELPIFQQGDAPYETSGGGIDPSGKVRTEEVCLALTVPTEVSMPDAGWPLVVYAHGTGGSFRGHVNDSVAGALSSVSTPSGEVAFAVLGIDQPEHGPRRGDSDASPNDLFFNFLNPDAARGNPIQGAIDQLSLARFAAQLDLSAGESGGDAIRVDPDKIVFFGHSQGSTEGSLILPYADLYKGAVLSGNGASLMDSLLTKTSPVNIAGVLPFVLSDFDEEGMLSGGEYHPVLTILQQWIDVADPLNFARALAVQPEEGHGAKHIFQTFGVGDTYSTPVTLETFAIAAELDEVEADSSADGEPIEGLRQIDSPACRNFDLGTDGFTIGVRRYGPPSDSDGHFVVFDVPEANDDASRFLGMAAAGEIPQIGSGDCEP